MPLIEKTASCFGWIGAAVVKLLQRDRHPIANQLNDQTKRHNESSLVETPQVIDGVTSYPGAASEIAKVNPRVRAALGQRADEIRADFVARIEAQFGRQFHPENYRHPITAKEHGAIFDHLAQMIDKRESGDEADYKHLEMLGRLYPDLREFFYRSRRYDSRRERLYRTFIDVRRGLGSSRDGTLVVNAMLSEIEKEAAAWKMGEGSVFFKKPDNSDSGANQAGTEGTGDNNVTNNALIGLHPSAGRALAGENKTEDEAHPDWKPPKPF